MKKGIGLVLCLLFVLGVCQTAQAEETTGANNTFEISANPLGLLLGLYNVQAYYALPETRKHALGLEGGYFNYNLVLTTISGVTVGPGWRYFFSDAGMGGHGAVVGLKAPLGFYTLGTANLTIIPFLAELLYRWNWGGFTLALGGAFGYAIASASGTTTETKIGFTSSGPAYGLSFNLGYAF